MNGRRPVGRFVLGALLVLIGVGGIFAAAGVAVPWAALLPSALILIGAGMLADVRHRPEPGLMVVGIILTVVLLVANAVSFRVDANVLAGGVGPVTERPVAVVDLQHYRLAAGELTVDLRSLDLPSGTTTVVASVGAGKLTVLVPPSVTLQVRADTGAGQLTVLDDTRQGLAVELVRTFPGTGDRTLELDLSAGVGQVEVSR